MIEMRLPGIDVGPTGPTHPLTDIDTPTLITAAQSVARLDTATRWYLGDLVCELHHRDGPTALVTLAEQWHHQATLAECAAVAATFTPDRRRSGLSWSHHANVARTVRDTAEQDQWLERAETDRLSPRALRAKIVEAAAPPQLPGTETTPNPPQNALRTAITNGATLVLWAPATRTLGAVRVIDTTTRGDRAIIVLEVDAKIAEALTCS